MTTTVVDGASTIGASSAAPPGTVEIRAHDARHDAESDRFVLAHPRGSFFHLAGWRRAVERVFHHAPAGLCAWRGTELVGMLPMMRCTGFFGRRHLVSMPYGVYGGAIAESLDVERALVDAAVRAAEEERVGRLELRYLVDPEVALLPSDLYATFIQELPAEPELVMKSMPKRARAEVRKAIEKHGLELSQGAWYLGDLVSLFHESKKQLGSPGLPLAWFEALSEEFGDRVVVHLARRGNQAIAATMSFLFRDTMCFYYIGTTDDANRSYNVTNYLCTRLQEYAVERGFKHFDLGRSRTDSGAFHFKVHQGFTPRPLHYRYKLVKSSSLPKLTPSNPKTKLLRDAWTKLPDWVTEDLSARLARYLV